MLRKSTPPQHSGILKDELDLRDIMKTAFQPMIYSTSFTPVKEKFDKIIPKLYNVRKINSWVIILQY